jgi:hypothetical protein
MAAVSTDTSRSSTAIPPADRQPPVFRHFAYEPTKSSSSRDFVQYRLRRLRLLRPLNPTQAKGVPRRIRELANREHNTIPDEPSCFRDRPIP